MGLQGFIQAGYYSKIGIITINTDINEVYFTLRTYDVNGGVEVLPPVSFIINEKAEYEKYLGENPIAELTAPEYPAICAARDAMVPMWTEESTQNEKNEYNNAKIVYKEAVKTYNQAVRELEKNARIAARENNTYNKYFQNSMLFNSSNPLKCAYKYLRNLDSFIGVNDAED